MFSIRDIFKSARLSELWNGSYRNRLKLYREVYNEFKKEYIEELIDVQRDKSEFKRAAASVWAAEDAHKEELEKQAGLLRDMEDKVALYKGILLGIDDSRLLAKAGLNKKPRQRTATNSYEEINGIPEGD